MDESSENSGESSPGRKNGNNSSRVLLTARINTTFLSKKRVANVGITLGIFTLAGGVVLAALNLGLALTIVGGVIAAVGLFAILIASIYKASISKSIESVEDKDSSDGGSPASSRRVI